MINATRAKGFFVVWWRLRKSMVRDFTNYRPSPWWSLRAWWATTKMWWGPFKRGADFRG